MAEVGGSGGRQPVLFESTRRSSRSVAPSLLVVLALVSAFLVPTLLSPSATAAPGDWTTVGELNTPRYNHTATLLQPPACNTSTPPANYPCGKVLAVGGVTMTKSSTVTSSTTTSSSTTSSTSSTTTSTTAPDAAVISPTSSAELFTFDPSGPNGIWTYATSAGVARSLHTATLRPDGKVLVVGGTVGSDGATSASELYDPVNDTWTPAAPLALARFDHTATLLSVNCGAHCGKVLVVGGRTAVDRPTASAELYEPETGLWVPAADLGTPRYGHAAVELDAGGVLVVGGKVAPEGAAGPIYTSESEERYYPAAAGGVWQQPQPSGVARALAVATPLSNENCASNSPPSWCGKVLVAGSAKSTQLFDPATTSPWSFTDAVEELPLSRSGTAALLGSGKVLVVPADPSSPKAPRLFDPAAETGKKWTSTGPAHHDHWLATVTSLSEDYVLAAGGFLDGAPQRVAEVYDGRTPVPPGPPTDVVAKPGDGSATVEWYPPTADGGSAISSYTVTASPGGATTTVSGTLAPTTTTTVPGAPPTDPAPPPKHSARVTGLTNGVAYSLTVRAANAFGVGEGAVVSGVVPGRSAGAPRDVTAKPGNREASVTWFPPSDTGTAPITGYTVRATEASTGSTAGVVTVDAATSMATLTGLARVPYVFEVRAVNAYGEGTAGLSQAVQPLSLPGPPSNATATAGDAAATVSWYPAADGGIPIRSYTVTASPGGLSTTVVGEDATTATVRGLANATTYTFTVTATNDDGSGPPSPPSNGVTPVAAAGGPPPAGVPSAPTGVTAVAGDRSATVSWLTPPSDGGTPITHYTVTAAPGGSTASVTGSARSARVGGLVNGTPYRFTVRAGNALGDSGDSLPSDPVTPLAPPPAGGTGNGGERTSTPQGETTTTSTQSTITRGYTLLAADGGIFAFGEARFFGSTGGMRLNRPVVGMAGTPSGNGYWLVASDGGIFAFGDAAFFGSTGSISLNQPILGMAATPSGNGYWLVASDGGIFAFGDAGFFGSTGATRLNQPIVGIAATSSGNGYWLVASDGGIFAFGDAAFFGSTGATRLNQPIAAMAATARGNGYWLAAADGGIFAFGDAGFFGSAVPFRPASTVVVASTATGRGYWLSDKSGRVFAFGDAPSVGDLSGQRLNAPVVGFAPAPSRAGEDRR